ncbi:MAG: hypothetical protein Q3990_09025 [Desulfovibrionaceae bacterium]|nr:hypothetical protein [Desulfovibrionaceae bacterium]
MTAYRYEKWDPNGNTTLFFPDDVPASEKPTAEEIARALAPGQLDAEQAGFADNGRRYLRMAGGEFCVNATLAFGAHLDRLACKKTETAREYEVGVSGWSEKIQLKVDGMDPLWKVTARLTMPSDIIENISDTCALVRLPGISHLLCRCSSPLPQDKKEAAMALLKKYSLLEEDAAGVIWWQEEHSPAYRQNDASLLRIWPVVRVRAVETLYEETSCGSGSMALACYKYMKDQQEQSSVLQPGGCTLSIRIVPKENAMEALVTGQVKFAEEGSWLS